MTRHRQFTTAAARRRADPIVWEIDGIPLHLRAVVDIVEVASAVEALRDPADENSARSIAAKRQAMLDILRQFVEPGSHASLEEVAPSLDMALLAEMVRDLAQEYAGTGNPTSSPSLPDGSPATGESSTDGAPAAAST